MRFRQVHLDFHTSEAIPGIGAAFDKQQFQNALKIGEVNSITVFSKCHHGWSYHPTDANEMHPHLQFDLLGAMIEAAHEMDVLTPVYISAGLDEKTAVKHPEWLIRNKEDRTNWVKTFLEPGYHQLCFNSPYLPHLLEQIREVVTNYDADGIFLDIVGVRECYCHNCMNTVRKNGGDPRDVDTMKKLWERTYVNYTTKVRETIDAMKPGLPVFHNGGHIARGRRDLAHMNSHLELESLPTGGWGYDHFPLSVRYAQQLGLSVLGMTGKFHTTWGEFGGFKHPNALRYETALSIANGAHCSVGDQLHPNGKMDWATYQLIGAAFKEVKAREAWCSNAENVADIGLLSTQAAGSPEAAHARTSHSDAGAVRMLLEGKILFDVIDWESDLLKYKIIILPDQIVVNEDKVPLLQQYVDNGGKLFVTGTSALNQELGQFVVDMGLQWTGPTGFNPDYFRPSFELKPNGMTSYVMYSKGQRVVLDGATELGSRENPYFNREAFTFSSHQHTPNRVEHCGPGMTENRHGMYLAWNVFEEYATKGSLHLKEIVIYGLKRLLGQTITIQTDLPAQGIVTIQRQNELRRHVLHLLYASPVKRGNGIEVIEDIIPLTDISVSIRLEQPVLEAVLVPENQPLALTQTADGRTQFIVPRLECHQMIELR